MFRCAMLAGVLYLSHTRLRMHYTTTRASVARCQKLLASGRKQRNPSAVQFHLHPFEVASLMLLEKAACCI